MRTLSSPHEPPGLWPKGAYNRTDLGEQLLRTGPNGAVAYFGCNTGSQPGGITLLDGFPETRRWRTRSRLGDCRAGAVTYYQDRGKLATLRRTKSWYPASVFFQGMKFMLFGDLTLLMPMASAASGMPRMQLRRRASPPPRLARCAEVSAARRSTLPRVATACSTR